MAKSPDAFRTISEVSDWLGTPTHVLRFWESRFSQVRPVKRAGGRRYYRRTDMALLGGIRRLLHDDGITIKGVQKILREKGAKHVCELCLEPFHPAADDADPNLPAANTKADQTPATGGTDAVATQDSPVMADEAADADDLAAAPEWSIATEARIEPAAVFNEPPIRFEPPPRTAVPDDDPALPEGPQTNRLQVLYGQLSRLRDRVAAGMSAN